jgi:predicted GIY-YIG superfamily endonuclease
MAEWLKAPVLKTGEVKASVGSNPTPSASASGGRTCYIYVLHSLKNRRVYIGSSAEPDVRFAAHNAGKVRSTKAHRPWECLLVEEHRTGARRIRMQIATSRTSRAIASWHAVRSGRAKLA